MLVCASELVQVRLFQCVCCNYELYTGSKSSSIQLWKLVSAIAGGVVLILIIVLVIIPLTCRCYCKQKRKRKYNGSILDAYDETAPLLKSIGIFLHNCIMFIIFNY